MDIFLIKTVEGINIRPASIHGMLWLQTHFEAKHWDSLANNQVLLPKNDLELLSEDAQKAGLTLQKLPLLAIK